MVLRALSDLRRGECSACIVFGALSAIAIAYWIIAPFFSPWIVNDVLDGPLMVVSFVAGAYYANWTLLNCRRKIDRPIMLRFGICLAWIGNGFWRLSRSLYATGLFKGTVGEHDMERGFWILVLLVAGVLHILAIDMEEGKPKLSKVLAASISVFLGLALISAIRLIEG